MRKNTYFTEFYTEKDPIKGDCLPLRCFFNDKTAQGCGFIR